MDDDCSFVVYSNGMMYKIYIDEEIRNFILGSPEFMYDSKIGDIPAYIYDKIMENQEENELLEKTNTEKFKEFLPIKSDDHFDVQKEINKLIDETSNIEGMKRCRKCKSNFIEFFLASKGCRCAFCWVEFKEEVLDFYEKMYFIDDMFKSPIQQQNTPIMPPTNVIINSTEQEFNDITKKYQTGMDFKSFKKVLDSKINNSLSKEKEIDIKNKIDFIKFKNNDKEYLKSEIERLKSQRDDLLDKNKYKAASIINDRIKAIEKKIS